MASIRRSVGRRGANGRTDVVTVKYLLNGNLHRLTRKTPLEISGSADEDVYHAIEDFQRSVMHMPIPDGAVRPRGPTLRSLNQYAIGAPQAYYPKGPQEPLAEIAAGYVGLTETRNNRMGSDPQMRAIFEADYMTIGRRDPQTDGYPWCAAFVSLCTQKLLDQSRVHLGIVAPREASVTRFRTMWAPTQKCLIFGPHDRTHSAHKGDIVVYTFSHIGIVTAVSGANIDTIEGNTNEAGSREGTGVLRKTRPIGQVRCFIRLPVPFSADVHF